MSRTARSWSSTSSRRAVSPALLEVPPGLIDVPKKVRSHRFLWHGHPQANIEGNQPYKHNIDFDMTMKSNAHTEAHREGGLHMKKGTLLKQGIIALILVMVTGVLGMGLQGSASTTSAAVGDPVTVGIDFLTADNTSTSFGAIQTCLEVPSGGT